MIRRSGRRRLVERWLLARHGLLTTDPVKVGEVIQRELNDYYARGGRASFTRSQVTSEKAGEDVREDGLSGEELADDRPEIGDVVVGGEAGSEGGRIVLEPGKSFELRFTVHVRTVGDQ